MIVFKLLIAVLFLLVMIYQFVVEQEWLFLKGSEGLSNYAHDMHKRLDNFEERVIRNSEKVNKIQGIISFVIKLIWILLTIIALLF